MHLLVSTSVLCLLDIISRRGWKYVFRIANYNIDFNFKNGISISKIEKPYIDNDDVIEEETKEIEAESKRISQTLEENVKKTMPLIIDRIRKQFNNGLLHYLPFKKFKKSNIVLRKITFGLKKGEIFGLIGPNGAGKSKGHQFS